MYRVFTCLTNEHDWRLVVVAGVICFFTSLVAMSLFRRAQATTARARAVWVTTAAAPTGRGTWATHFIAMLAYDPGIEIAYNIGLTSLSLLAAATVTAIGLAVAVYTPARWGAPLGGAIVGAGVACMHYTGMWAAELPGHVTWAYDLVVLSILFGMLLGVVALTIAARRRDGVGTIAGAVFLTLAIVSHHFTAMGAVEIVADPTRAIDNFSLSAPSLAVAIAGVATAVLATSLAGSFVDRRVREHNLHLASALDNIHQALCMFDAATRLIICNERSLEIYGLTREQAYPGVSLHDLLKYRRATGTFFQDIDKYVTAAKQRVIEGKIFNNVVEVKGRIISISNRPISGGGWVSTHEDITEQRRHDQE